MSDLARPNFREISTIQELLGDANTLFDRYGLAMRNYLFAILEDEDAVHDVLLELRVKMLDGRFARWQPGQGRFRFYLKQAVLNEARQYLRKNRKHRLEKQLDLHAEDVPVGDKENPWLHCYRGAVLQSGFDALQAYQTKHRDAGNIFFTLMQLLTTHPDSSDAELAELLTQRAGRPITVANLAQQKKRTRRKFAELLVEEVKCTLETPTPSAVEDELKTLGLFEHVEQHLSLETEGE